MKIFKDDCGRDWTLFVDVSELKRIKARINVDLLEIVEGPLLERLSNDVIFLVDLLWVMVEPRAEEQGITDVQFAMGLKGNALDRAVDALLEALIEFFPEKKSKLLKRALAKARLLETEIFEQAEKSLEDPAKNAAMRERLGLSSTSSQESPAAIQLASHFANLT